MTASLGCGPAVAGPGGRTGSVSGSWRRPPDVGQNAETLACQHLRRMSVNRQSLPALVESSGGAVYRDLHGSGFTPVVGSQILRR